MSFLDDIVSIGQDVGGFLGGNSIASTLVKIVGLGFIASQMNKSLANNNTSNTTPNIDLGVRLQIPPASDAKIPVLYGSAYWGGIITDAAMTNNNQTMSYCLTLSETTGIVKSTNQQTIYTFNDVYWNNNRVVFNDDGLTIDYTIDRDGNIDRSLNGLVKIHFYAKSSTQPILPTGYSNPSAPAAWAVMPTWGNDATYSMNELLFAIVTVNYSRDKGVTGIGTLKFHVSSTMYKPGDVLYDYMTNTRYGAGINSNEILV